ncbi:hypothetical protein WISP_121552 [Willisornis vidua]|uniref:Uncharacterized protein n=1 Tax=Willisornis vidua TaxID=1566151 RepID=A0ABQ9CSE7_9PASS|nr:hypothetical protein WISP_121552 [Willisornis vidua]
MQSSDNEMSVKCGSGYCKDAEVVICFVSKEMDLAGKRHIFSEELFQDVYKLQKAKFNLADWRDDQSAPLVMQKKINTHGQLGVISKLTDGALDPFIQIIDKDVKQD